MSAAIEPSAARAYGRVTVARSVEEVEALGGLLGSLDRDDIDAEPDFFLAVQRTRVQAIAPAVIVVECAGRAPLVAVARLEETRMAVQLAPGLVHRPRIRSLLVVPGGVHGVEAPEDAAWLLDLLRREAERAQADVLVLSKLRPESALYRAAADVRPRRSRDAAPAAHPRFSVALPDSLDAFMAARSKNTRRRERNFANRVERELGDRISVRRFERGDDIVELCGEMERVAECAWQRDAGVGFRDDPEQRAMLGMLLERDWLRAWVLSVDGLPAAFWYGTRYRGRLCIGSPGYDPAHSDLRLGTFLQLRMISDLCADPDVHVLDYGHGDARYKRSFGDTSWVETDILVFGTGLRAQRLRVVRAGAHLAKATATRLFGENRLRRLARRRRSAEDESRQPAGDGV
jgi:hypothetical protein